MVLFGIMHSPEQGDRMFLPTRLFEMEAASRNLVIQLSVAYFAVAGMLLAVDHWNDEEVVHDE